MWTFVSELSREFHMRRNITCSNIVKKKTHFSRTKTKVNHNRFLLLLQQLLQIVVSRGQSCWIVFFFFLRLFMKCQVQIVPQANCCDSTHLPSSVLPTHQTPRRSDGNHGKAHEGNEGLQGQLGVWGGWLLWVTNTHTSSVLAQIYSTHLEKRLNLTTRRWDLANFFTPFIREAFAVSDWINRGLILMWILTKVKTVIALSGCCRRTNTPPCSASLDVWLPLWSSCTSTPFNR